MKIMSVVSRSPKSGERGQREAEALEKLFDPAHGCWSWLSRRVSRCVHVSYIQLGGRGKAFTGRRWHQVFFQEICLLFGG